jgi:hypothetical protein
MKDIHSDMSESNPNRLIENDASKCSPGEKLSFSNESSINGKNRSILHTIDVIQFRLMLLLSFVSIGWLIFTGKIILGLARGRLHLDNGVAIAFITSSLATVMGLWLIGLKFYFSPLHISSNGQQNKILGPR